MHPKPAQFSSFKQRILRFGRKCTDYSATRAACKINRPSKRRIGWKCVDLVSSMSVKLLSDILQTVLAGHDGKSVTQLLYSTEQD